MSVRYMSLLTIPYLVIAVLTGPSGAATKDDATSPPPSAKTAPVTEATASSVPSDIQSAIEAVLQEKVKGLVDHKNDDGESDIRAAFSKQFTKVDSSTYLVDFHKDTSIKDQLKVERYVLTVKKDAAGKWAIAKEDLEDTYDSLYRGNINDQEAFKFDSFAFDREGMKVTTGPGTLYKGARQGKTEIIVFAARTIAYEYNPPDPKFAALYKKLKKDHASDVVFDAEYGGIQCDPATCEDLLATAFKGVAPTKNEEVLSVLKSKTEEYIKDTKKARRDNFFSGYQVTAEPGHKYYALEVAEQTPDRRVIISYDNWEPREVSYYVYNLDKFFPRMAKIYHYYSDQTVKAGTNSYDLERRDDPDARDYDLIGLKGTVDLALEDAETLSADLVYTLKVKRELRELPFFISRLRQDESEKKETKDPQLTINSIEDGSGKEMTWVKFGASDGIVILPQKVAAGTQITLHMRFANKAGIYAITPSFSVVDRFGWMPFVRFTDMIMDMDMTLRVPSRYKAIGIGKKVSESVKDGVQTTRWVADSPVEFPSIIFGDYLERPSSVVAKKADGTVVPVVIHVDKFGKIEGAEKVLEDLANQAANSINLYGAIFGVDYPYGKLDLVNDPQGAFYGQSPSSLIYLGNGVFLSSGTAGALLESGSISKFNREVVPHEVAHQWWGSLIPNANNGNYWFVESLAEYSAALYVENSQESPEAGHKAYLEKVERWRRRVLDVDLQSSVQDASMLWSGALGAGYQAAVYNKGPYAFHVMRSTWGDEKFFKFLKDLAQGLAHHAIVTRDIQKIAEKSFGGNMDFFFDQWLRGVGQPEYTFAYKVRQTEDGKYEISGTISQRTLVGSKKDPVDNVYFTAIVPITVVTKSGKTLRYPLRVQGASLPFQFKVAEEPKEVTFNKYGESLAYDVIVKKMD